MLKTVLVALLAVGAFSSVAEARRPDTRAMTCRQAADFVRANGPVVMTYGYSDRAGYLYSRFSAQQCVYGPGDFGPAAWVPTKDSPSCFIGYHCN